MSASTVPHQLPEDLPTPFEVSQDKTFTVQPVNAAGISFLPASGNQGGYPLTLTINDDKKRTHVVRGPEFIKGSLVDVKIKVDSAAGGGVWGDKWTVTLLEAAAAAEAPRPRTDNRGNLLIRNGGERVLFDLDTAWDYAPYAAAFSAQAAGLFYISPKAPQAFSMYDGSNADAFAAWDLGQYTRINFHVDQVTMSGGGADWDCIPFIEVTHSEFGRTSRYFPLGSNGQIGSFGATPWGSNEQGLIELGAGEEELTDYMNRIPQTYSRVRFGLMVAVNVAPWEAGPSMVFPGGWGELRIKAVAW